MKSATAQVNDDDNTQTGFNLNGFDVNNLPVIVTIEELSRLYRLSEWTIRRRCQLGLFSPVPWERYPYRWRREDIIADIKRAQRPERPRRAHGFAAVKKPQPAKATLIPERRSRR